MKFHLVPFFFLTTKQLVWLSTTTITTTHAFVVVSKHRATYSNYFATKQPLKSSTDDDDDWFADFDDFKFDNVGNSDSAGSRSFAQPNFDSSQKSYRGGGGQQQSSYRTNDGPYQRDTSRDTSNVDEAAILSMLSERRQAQQSRDYDTADAIRDSLMTDHNVGVNDRERTWRTGCSSGGSGGRKYGGGSQRRERRPNNNRKRDFGPNGHDYQSVGSGNNSDLSDDQIHSLLAERLQAKFSRDYNVADSIQNQLIDSGVFVHDGLKEWRADGEPFERNEGGRDGGRRNSRMGPHGHDYSMSYGAGDNTSSLSDEEIHALLAERLQAKKQHNFRQADALQQDLIAAGVFVHDKLKEWRADGISFEGNFNNDNNNRRDSRQRDNDEYTQSPHSEEIPEGMTDRMVTALLKERAKFKSQQDYTKADGIRDGLKERYNIHVDDRTYEWSVGGSFGDDRNLQRELSQSFASREYIQSPSSLDLANPEDDLPKIQALLQERVKFKQERNYAQADAIRDQLSFDYDIILHDKLKLWSVGGSFDEEALPSRRKKREYSLRGSPGDLTEDDIQTIQTLLAERAEAKKDRDFDTADSIRDQLTQDYNIVTDDTNLEWKVDNDEYVMIMDDNETNPLSSEDVAMVESKIKERFVFKQQRLFEEADAIRDDLKEQYGIQINDRTKEWHVVVDTRTYRNNARVSNNDSYGAFEKEEDASMGDDDDEEEKSIDAKLDEALDGVFDDFNTDNDDDESSIDTKLDKALDGVFLEDFDSPSLDNEVEEDEETSIQSSSSAEETTAFSEDESIDDDDDTDVNGSSRFTEEELQSLTVPLLKEKLKEAGLRVSGKKAELVARLLTA
mmetsp:Transcript_28843/g.42565  ORF Transcript_28843/g.42565 Transcript_28843/m.42565 type:complete len:846 (-) Transcript_28843:18-2555(-)